MMKLLIFSLFLIFTSACTTVTSKNASRIYTQDYRFVSESDFKKVKVNCPASKTSWKKQSWKKLLPIISSCASSRKWKQVERIANHIAQRDHLSPWGAYYLSLASQAQKNSYRALWMIDLALKKAPNLGLLHYQKGQILWSMKDFGSAISSYQTAIKKDDKLTEASLFLGQIYMRDGQYDEAISFFEKAIKYEPKSLVANASLAESYLSIGNTNYAIDYLNKAINIKPKDVKLRLRLGFIYEKYDKNPVAALNVYRTLLKLKTSRLIRGKIKMSLPEKIKSLEAIVSESAPKSDKRKPASKVKEG